MLDGTRDQLASEAALSSWRGPSASLLLGTTDEAVSSAASHKHFDPAEATIIQSPRFQWGFMHLFLICDYHDHYFLLSHDNYYYHCVLSISIIVY